MSYAEVQASPVINHTPIFHTQSILNTEASLLHPFFLNPSTISPEHMIPMGKFFPHLQCILHTYIHVFVLHERCFLKPTEKEGGFTS